MNIEDAIRKLEWEWEKPNGFLSRLRRGTFDPEGFRRLLYILESVNIGDTPYLSRRFVELTWFIPLFVSWQVERVARHGGNPSEVESANNRILDVMYKVLGIP